MNKFLLYIFLILPATLCLTISCKKYLDKKPESNLDLPNTWQDLQALLDNPNITRESGTSLIELVADDYYVRDQRWDAATDDIKGGYIWSDEFAQYTRGWQLPYQPVYYSNVVLDNLSYIKENTPVAQYHNLEGTALFCRSISFFHLLQLYCKPYSPTANTDLGIVLKLGSSVTDKANRSTLKQSYDQIINDLKRAADILPQHAANIMRPDKVAANALLARVYLSMADYENAKKYAELTINDRPDLLDYNDLTPSNNPVLPLFLSNPEILITNVFTTQVTLTTSSSAITDSLLYLSYDDSDIRKKAFFTGSSAGGAGTYRFRGSYYNISNSTIFYGPTSAEMYLILAECLVREGQVQGGLDKLNFLLTRRYTNAFTGYQSANQEEALNIVLQERRKELVFRGLRWTDIRRLNLEGKNIELRRYLKGNYYVLPPNDPRSVLLIPNDEIIRSGITQNLR